METTTSKIAAAHVVGDDDYRIGFNPERDRAASYRCLWSAPQYVPKEGIVSVGFFHSDNGFESTDRASVARLAIGERVTLDEGLTVERVA